MEEKQVKILIAKIKEKKLLQDVNDLIVHSEINKYFKIYPKELNKVDENNKKSVKKCIKFVRDKLRFSFEEFQNKKDYSGLNEQEILKTHKSTKERYDYYKEVYSRIFKKTGKITSVLDLGCGVNPLSFPDKEVKYYASDIGDKELEVVKKHFEKNNVQGKVFVYDIKNIRKDLPKADVVFLFKVLDALEKKGHRLAEKIIKSLNSKFVVISFSTVTVSGEKMNYPYRGWMDRMLKRLKLKYSKFEIPNELFYVVKL